MMLKVFIADDEEQVRIGLKKIINWEAYGFEVCGEAKDGETAYNKMMLFEPDLVLLDIRMPKLQGLAVAAKAREAGFRGRIIILSGYSEFKYAQEAIQCNVDYYLTKPIEEEELQEAVLSIKRMIQKENLHMKHINYYQEQAKFKIIKDMIESSKDHQNKSLSSMAYSLKALNLDADWYQIVILDADLFKPIEGGNQKKEEIFSRFCYEMMIPATSKNVEHLVMQKIDVVLLKGKRCIDRLKSLDEKLMNLIHPGIYVFVGRVVDDINEIYYSYHEALAIKERRFFAAMDQYMLDYEALPEAATLINYWHIDEARELANLIFESIEMNHKKQLGQIITDLIDRIQSINNSVESIKVLLAELYIVVKQNFERKYVATKEHLPSSTKSIVYIQRCIYLDEIIDFYRMNFDIMARTIGHSNSNNIIDEIINYMHNNYMKDIRLKNLAPKFGYNSSYLGKLFTKKVGESFNDYIHKVRIVEAKKLLSNKKLKIYEISKNLGYKNVDYFHRKFKELNGCSPNEYRNKQ